MWPFCVHEHGLLASASFQKPQTATFRDLWAAFDSQLVGPVPGPATITDYKAIGRDYLLPELGDRLLKDIDPAALSPLCHLQREKIICLHGTEWE
jgi:hypothetical protein